jgi:hypothetical protein
MFENPVTEPKRRQNPKKPLPFLFNPNGYSIFLTALNKKQSVVLAWKMIHLPW